MIPVIQNVNLSRWTTIIDSDAFAIAGRDGLGNVRASQLKSTMFFMKVIVGW